MVYKEKKFSRDSVQLFQFLASHRTKWEKLIYQIYKMKDRDAYGVVVSSHLAHFPCILGTRLSLSLLCSQLSTQPSSAQSTSLHLLSQVILFNFIISRAHTTRVLRCQFQLTLLLCINFASNLHNRCRVQMIEVFCH